MKHVQQPCAHAHYTSQKCHSKEVLLLLVSFSFFFCSFARSEKTIYEYIIFCLIWGSKMIFAFRGIDFVRFGFFLPSSSSSSFLSFRRRQLCCLDAWCLWAIDRHKIKRNHSFEWKKKLFHFIHILVVRVLFECVSSWKRQTEKRKKKTNSNADEGDAT